MIDEVGRRRSGFVDVQQISDGSFDLIQRYAAIKCAQCLVVALTIGLVFNYILFWNRPLLLAQGLPEFPIYITLIAGITKLALSFWLVPTYGIVAAGALLSYYYITSVGIMALRGVRQIQHNENRAHH